MGNWAEQAERTIASVHAALPEDAPLEDRIKAIDDAYPFGMREYSPYKTWLRKRRNYLVRYGYIPKGGKGQHYGESPMERAIRKTKEREESDGKRNG